VMRASAIQMAAKSNNTGQKNIPQPNR
jgi:hypothetical protein